MSQPSQHPANYPKHLTVLTVARWLAGLLALLMGLNACVPAPSVAQPTATTAPAIGLTPDTASTATISTGPQVTLGFKVRGWT